MILTHEIQVKIFLVKIQEKPLMRGSCWCNQFSYAIEDKFATSNFVNLVQNDPNY